MPREPVKGAIVYPDGGRLAVLWDLHGKPTSNIYHFRGTAGTPVTQSLADSLAAFLRTQFSAILYQPIAGAGLKLRGCSLLDISNTTNAMYTSVDAGLAGTSATPDLPADVSVTVTLNTGKRGPLYRGRSFIFGFATEACVAGGLISPAAQAAARIWVEAIQDGLGGSGYTLTVLSREYPEDTVNPKPAKSVTMDDVTGIVVRDAHFDTQRRRDLV